MRLTDVLLLVIAVTLIAGVVVIVRQGRRRSAETEMMRTALYSIAQLRYDLRRSEPVAIKFDGSTNQAIKRLQQTAVDIQGAIELASRYAVANLPAEVLGDMKVPTDWTVQVHRQGITAYEKRGD